MCLGIPGRVLEVRDESGARMARVQFAGVVRDACLDTLPEAVVGDYVLVHVGFALAKIDAVEAERAWRVLEGIGQTAELAAEPPDERSAT